MSHSFSYPRAVIGVLADLWDAAVMVVEMLVIDVRANTATDSLTDVMVDVDVDTLDDVEIIVVAPVVIALMATLKFVAAPSEEVMPFFWPAFSC